MHEFRYGEFSSTWNFGVDFSLFQGRLSGTLEYYIQDTKDLLWRFPPIYIWRKQLILPTLVKLATRVSNSP